ncbi:MAG: NAD(P)-dependent alcohol dehydrogenase [Woeseiaceae bacterium]
MKLRYKIAGGMSAVLILLIVAFGGYISHDSPCIPAEKPQPGSETMMAIRHGCFGGPEVLELAKLSKPVPDTHEIRVRIEAAAVNPLDWHYMRGSPYIMRLMGAGVGTPADMRLGVDYAGVVESVGSAVTRFRPGDRVFGSSSGAFAEYLVTREDGAVVPVPENLSSEQAAAVPVAGLTALQALRDAGDLQPGQKVLVNGASGGVGTFAVQIAKAMGAEVHGVCSTRNVERVYALGADRVIDYTKESYIDSGETYDLIIDNVGNHSLLANRKVMSDSSTLVIVGGPGGDWVGPLIRPLAATALQPFVAQNFAVFLARMKRDDLLVLADMMASGKITPVIDRQYALAEVPEAIRYSETGRARGKIIIRMDRPGGTTTP